MYYIVQPGDSLFRISQRFAISLSSLIAANPQIDDPNLIFPGQVVIIPRMPVRRPVAEIQRVVRPGDTLYRIAREFGVTLSSIIQLNPQIFDPNLIFPGQIITVRRGTACPANVISFVNKFMGARIQRNLPRVRSLLTEEASGRLDPRSLIGLNNPVYRDYDFISCYRVSQWDYVTIVAVYRQFVGRPGTHDIIVEHVLVTTVGGQLRISDVNVQVVLNVAG